MNLSSWIANPWAHMPAWLAFEPFGWNISLFDLCIAVVLWIGAWIVLSVGKTLITRTLERYAWTDWSGTTADGALGFVRTLPAGLSITLGLYPAIVYLGNDSPIMPYIRGLLFMAVIWYGTKLALAIVDRFARDAFMTERDEKKGDATTYHLVMMGMRTLAIVIAILLILTNFGVEIAPLLASLGVGGIAIAFALQSVLADIFASISIYFDRPFKIGDYVTVGTDGGHVQKVGIKSTRIKTLEGQELVIPNKDITNVRVNNYATLERRRVILGFSVIYTTPTATIRRVPEIVQEIAQTIPNFTLDRVHFSNFGVYSLDFEVVYYAETAEYAAHMDTKQTFLLALMEAFEREKITFAYPTQTVFVRGMEKPSEETAEFIAS